VRLFGEAAALLGGVLEVGLANDVVDPRVTIRGARRSTPLTIAAPAWLGASLRVIQDGVISSTPLEIGSSKESRTIFVSMKPK
jgi:hypothetical protein